MAASIASAEASSVSRSTSTKTLRAPRSSTMLGVETHVMDAPTTSSPGPMPMASRARCMSAVPLVAAMACFAPVRAATMSSSSATLGPVVIQPLRSTSATAAMSSSVMDGRQNGRKVARITGLYPDMGVWRLEADSVLVAKFGHVHRLSPNLKAGTQVGQRQTEGVGDLLGVPGAALDLGDLSGE